MTQTTNVLVVGAQDIARLAAGETMSAKQRKAARMRRDGHDIQLISETDLLRMPYLAMGAARRANQAPS